MLKTYRTWALTAVLGAAALALPLGGASAASFPVAPRIAAGDGNPLLLNVMHPENVRPHRWNRRLHGNRCRYRQGGCRHFYRGYYYHTPWWTITLPVIVGRHARDYDDDDDDGEWSDDHVEWCSDRYRSYDEDTNTWVGNSGRVYQCNSPY